MFLVEFFRLFFFLLKLFLTNNVMGSNMSLILPSLYVGSYRNANDHEQLKKHSITHIVSVYEDAKPLNEKYKFLCINALDIEIEDLSPHFSNVNDFVHDGRRKGAVLIHCVAGISRSVTFTIAYIMTVTGLSYLQAFTVVQSRRPMANPNDGFKKQLEIFGRPENLNREITRFRSKFSKKYDRFNDLQECRIIIARLEQNIS